MVQRKQRINLIMVIVFSVLSIVSGVISYCAQSDAIIGNTNGLSVGLYISLTIFFTVNFFISFISWNKHRTSGTIFKVFSYAVPCCGQVIYLSKCLYEGYLRGESLFHDDDFIIIGLVSIVLFVFLTREYVIQNAKHYSMFHTVIGTYPALAIVSVSVAQFIFGIHLFNFGVSGLSGVFIILGIFDVLMRLVQNKIDIATEGKDQQKEKLLTIEYWNLASQLFVGLIFFIKV